MNAWVQWAAFGGVSVDDAFITFRYAANWAAGLGPVYNAGEHVEGYSNFLWLCVLSLAHCVLDDVDRLAQGIGLAAAAGSVALGIWSLVRVYAVQSRALLLLAAASIASSGYLGAWAVSGMESALHGLLLLGLWSAFALAQRGVSNPAVAAALLGMCVGLSRPEGLLVAFAFCVAHVLAAQDRKLAWRATELWAVPVAVLSVLCVYMAWRFSFYGPHWLPNSVRAKVGFSGAQVVRGADYVLHKLIDPYLPLLAASGLLLQGPRVWASWFGVALLFGNVAFIAVAGGDWSPGRFFAPLIPLGSVLAVAGLAQRGRLTRVAWFVACAIVVYAAITTGAREHEFRTTFRDNDLERIRIGKWLRDAAPRDSVLAVTAAGQLAYYSRLYTHDMLGLNDAHISSLQPETQGQGMAGHEKFDIHYSIDTVAPAIIVGGEVIPGLRRYLANTGKYALVPLRYENLLIRKGAIAPHQITRLTRMEL